MLYTLSLFSITIHVQLCHGLLSFIHGHLVPWSFIHIVICSFLFLFFVLTPFFSCCYSHITTVFIFTQQHFVSGAVVFFNFSILSVYLFIHPTNLCLLWCFQAYVLTLPLMPLLDTRISFRSSKVSIYTSLSISLLARPRLPRIN